MRNVSLAIPIVSRRQHSCFLPALKSGDEEEDEAVEGYDARDDEYDISVSALVDRYHPVYE